MRINNYTILCYQKLYHIMLSKIIPYYAYQKLYHIMLLKIIPYYAYQKLFFYN